MVSYAYFFAILVEVTPKTASVFFFCSYRVTSGKDKRMKIKYEFADGTVTEVEADESIGSFIVDDRRREDNFERNARRRCYSLDAADFEGIEFADKETPESILSDKDETEKIYAALEHLTEVQKRRFLMYASGISAREIGRREGVDHKGILKSINQAKKILKKFLS